MIKIDGLKLSVQGNPVALLTELTGIMHYFYEKDIASKKDLLDAVNLATVSDKQYSEQFMQIIENCESIQEDDGVSDYRKNRAKIHAYEDIVALVKVRR